MSSIDLVILGIVMEGPQSAYDIQKDVEYHHLTRWARVSVPSIYRKVIQLCEKGCLKSDVIRGERLSEKTVYSITDEGREYFERLMEEYACQDVSIIFDFNLVVANLNKLKKDRALELLSHLRKNILSSARTTEEYAAEYSDIPLTGRTVFEQQKLVYKALMEWLDAFEAQLRNS